MRVGWLARERSSIKMLWKNNGCKKTLSYLQEINIDLSKSLAFSVDNLLFVSHSVQYLYSAWTIFESLTLGLDKNWEEIFFIVNTRELGPTIHNRAQVNT